MPSRFTRRGFLQASAAFGALGLGGGLLRADKKESTNERLHVGVIGVAGQGDYDMSNVAAAGAAIVALCDVDERRAAGARKRFPKAKFYTDYRKLFDAKGLDAVVVATPDHHHAPATLRALKAGLHVYCEKPLTHTVQEARLVAEAAAKHKRVTQMGTQIHNEPKANYRRVVELIQSGAIGAVKEVHVWCARQYGGKERPKDSEPVPKGLHWDLWLGPAPERPYHHGPDKAGYGTYEPFNWRDWWDFGGGTLADMACHYMDLPFWALGLRHPTKVAAEGPRPHPESAPPWLIVRYEFPAREKLPAVKLTWYHGGKRPAHFAQGKLPRWGDGVLFVGDKGMLLADYTRRKLLPEKQFKDFVPPRPYIKDSVGHHKEWVEACKRGDLATTCNFGYSGALTEAVLLGNVAFRVGKALTWDAKKLQATNAKEAETFVRKKYRKGWELESV
jgi:predicted dehydrogenase